jgi:hypothetical protein
MTQQPGAGNQIERPLDGYSTPAAIGTPTAQPAFSRAFIRELGVSPSAWVRENEPSAQGRRGRFMAECPGARPEKSPRCSISTGTEPRRLRASGMLAVARATPLLKGSPQCKRRINRS